MLSNLWRTDKSPYTLSKLGVKPRVVSTETMDLPTQPANHWATASIKTVLSGSMFHQSFILEHLLNVSPDRVFLRNFRVSPKTFFLISKFRCFIRKYRFQHQFSCFCSSTKQARLVSLFWAQSTTKDYTRAKNNVPTVSYLLRTQVIKTNCQQQQQKSVLTQTYRKHTQTSNTKFSKN